MTGPFSFHGRSLARRIAIIVWIAVKLTLVAAMISRNIAPFIYAGF